MQLMIIITCYNYNYEVLKNNESSAMVRELLQIMTSRVVQGGARRSKHEPIPGDLSGRSADAPRFSKMDVSRHGVNQNSP